MTDNEIIVQLTRELYKFKKYKELILANLDTLKSSHAEDLSRGAKVYINEIDDWLMECS